MKKFTKKFLIVSLAAASAASYGQGWQGICLDPANTQPYSIPYGYIDLSTPLMDARTGILGTVTMGGQSGPCFAPARTLDASGRMAFGVGSVGTVQSDFDDDMALTFGWPEDPVGDFTYVRFTTNEAGTPAGSLLFGDGGVAYNFVGASRRYYVVGWSGTGLSVIQQVRLIGDAARISYEITNTGTADAPIGMLFGCWPAMLSFAGDDQTGAFASNTFRTPAPGRLGFNVLFDGRPVRTEIRRTTQNQDFPSTMKFMFGQTNAYGMRVDNVPPPETPDATAADLAIIGNYQGPVQGLIFGNNMRLNIAGDFSGLQNDSDIPLGEPTFIQRFPPAVVTPGASRTIVHYIRNVWSVADFRDPYTVVLDAPRLIDAQRQPDGTFASTDRTVRLWIDNQFAQIDKEVPLTNVRATINLPAGLTLAPGSAREISLARIDPNELRFVEWTIQSDNRTYGDLPISVDITVVPGPAKRLSSTIRVAANPTVSYVAGPNLIGMPYQFADTSLDAILGLTTGRDYVAYQWDPEFNGYQPVTTVQRGLGYWLVPNAAITNRTLNGAAIPTDSGSGGLLVSLKRGWNLISNPYNYAVPLAQLVGVAEDAPENALSWTELVQNRFVNSALTVFTPNPNLPGGGSYSLTQGANPLIQPHTGYWLFVSTFQPLRLVWPPVFTETLPNSGRSLEERWAQNDRQWRLQLAARSEHGVDTTTFVGVNSDARRAVTQQLMKAPAAPGSKLEMSVIDEVNSQPSRMAQSIRDRGGRQEWKLQVQAKAAGDVTVTWPNMGSLPRGMRVRLVDDATLQRVDLRSSTSYTFRVNEPTTRSFTLVAEPGGSNRPVIGNVTVRPSGRDNNSPVIINYALSGDALVTVRVLSSTGREVYTVSRGRSESSGENSVVWNLRDSANRAVAPGTYRVEILAETPGGERVRKVVPVNVIR